ncbi:hypothetical protein AC578_4561 [Pseudocercospora eumusae]|uniref:Uncharacterized protein n=1 Tax=Pseudocercospora eumusae TaxID=321146 RepID=A0A139HGI0_9PEZI|nr:hypothetical protein AC578_4561 [Pseudocercospora eumusae]
MSTDLESVSSFRPNWYLLMPRGITIDANEANQLTRQGGLSFFARAERAKSAHLDPDQGAIYIHAMQRNLVLQDYDMVRELHMMINHNQHAPRLLLARADIIRACTDVGSGEQYLGLASENLFEALSREKTDNPSLEIARLQACLSELSKSVQEFWASKKSEHIQMVRGQMGPAALMPDVHIRQMDLGQLQNAFLHLRGVSLMFASKLWHSQGQVARGTNSRDPRMNDRSAIQGAPNAPGTNMVPNGDSAGRSVQVSNGNAQAAGATPSGLANGGAQVSNVHSSSAGRTFASVMLRFVPLILNRDQLEGMTPADLTNSPHSRPTHLMIRFSFRKHHAFILYNSSSSSNMFRRPNLPTLNFPPINLGIQLLIHKSTNHNIIPSHHKKPSFLLLAIFLLIMSPNNPLHTILQRQIRHCVAGDEVADHAAAVDEDEADFF